MSLWCETFVEDYLRPQKPRRFIGHTHTTSTPGIKACFYTKVCRNIIFQFYPAGSTVTLSLSYWTCISIDSATYAERDDTLAETSAASTAASSNPNEVITDARD
jgi:hypothetical protein